MGRQSSPVGRMLIWHDTMQFEVRMVSMKHAIYQLQKEIFLPKSLRRFNMFKHLYV